MTRPRDLEIEALLGACRAAGIGVGVDKHGALMLMIPATVPEGTSEALTAAVLVRAERVIDFLSDPGARR